MRKLPALAAALLLLLSFPSFAQECQDPIRSIGVQDGKTGAALRIDWFLSGTPQSQTLSGHDLDEPVVLAPTQRSFVYVPEQPGEKHMTLTVVTECGTFSRTVKYHVQQCDVAVPPITVDKTTVLRGDTLTASIDPLPGHTVRWIVTGGTPSATEGESIQIVAGSFGTVRIQAFVSRGNQNAKTCEGRATINVPITQPCTINEPQVHTFPQVVRPSDYFQLGFFGLGFGETATFNVTNATVIQTSPYNVEVTTPATGSFTIEYTISKTGCSRTFSRTFEVTPCAPTATVSLGAVSCSSSSVAVDFTGTGPWQGYWSDGSYFFTWDPHMERTFWEAGTYTVSSFMDLYCEGTVTGSAEVPASLTYAEFVIDDVVNGLYYGYNTCPDLVRTARLIAPIPAGSEVVWSVNNATIVSGQGTATLQFSATNPGDTAVAAVFRNAAGCETTPHVGFLLTQGLPAVSMTVEPATIDAGGTAIVTVKRLNDFVVGTNLSSSLGDSIIPIGSIDPYTYQYQYYSTNGAGPATITATSTNACGNSSSTSAALTINPAAPVVATATIHQMGTSCLDYTVYAQLTGTAPFSGTWSNGTTFTSDYPWVYLYASAPGTYTLTEFRDANGPGTVNGEVVIDYTVLPTPQIAYSVSSACPNSTVTATLTTPVPEGATIWWQVYGTGTMLSGQGTNSIEIAVGEWYVYTSVRIYGPNACSPESELVYLGVNSNVQQPYFELYGVESGQSTQFVVYADPNVPSISFENSLGDPMELVSNDFPGFYVIRYTATHGPGESVVRIFGTNACGLPFESTRVMVVNPPAPPVPTAFLSQTEGETCGANVTVTFTGTAPFTATWSDTGETFTTSETTYTRFFPSAAGVWLNSVTDATGQFGGSNFIFVQPKNLPYVTFAPASLQICLGGTKTLSVVDVPPGLQVVWTVEGSNARIVSGQGTPDVVLEGLNEGEALVMAHYVTAEGCTGAGSGFVMTVNAQACSND